MIAIYARVSTEEQLKGFSIAGQIEDCKEIANTDEWSAYIDEGYTGEILNRPALTRMLNDVDAGLITKVICYDPDRLSRKLLNQLLITEKLEQNQVHLAFVKSNYQNDAEGQLYFQVRGAFSEFDKAKIKHNTMTGRYRKAKSGLVVKNSGLYGYDYSKAENMYQINKQEAAVVQMIFNYFTSPDSNFKGVNGIARHLTELGVPTKRGASVWHRQVVRQILLNEAYTGTYYQNKHDTEGDYVRKQAGEPYQTGRLRPREEWVETNIPRIIEPKQFKIAQALLKNARRRHAGYNRHPYLLSGLVRCGRCGETMNGRRTKSHGKDYFVYVCKKNYAGAKSKGCGRMMSESKLNHQVWTTIESKIASSPQLKSLIYTPNKVQSQAEIDHLQTKIHHVRLAQKRIIQLIGIGDEIDLQEIKYQLKQLQDEEKSMLHKWQVLMNKINKQDTKPSISNWREVVKRTLSQEERRLTITEKQTIIRMLIQEVEVIHADMIRITTF